ncbi:MAG: hypothetical protein PHS49_05400 [Candidatus Gracilibacteria bacterium]|nr:hypothetical protein [Candidatus Gracilibacteria bacterium]
MHKFTRFYFKSFEFDYSQLQAKFHYSFDNEVFFEEIIDFKNEQFVQKTQLDKDILNNLLFHLHIAFGISYYKLFPTKELIVESAYLDDFQIDFWKKFYSNGLGEFLFTNKISPKGLFDFVNKSEIVYTKKDFTTSDKSLVAIGGGKDSIVTIELLKKADIDFDLVVFGKIDQLKQYTSDISEKSILQITRKISENLFELNNKGYYNGHVPITGLIAFALEVACYLYDYKYIILSNEKSASFGNTFWEGLHINHQYSKSLDFEKDFENYVSKYISSNTKYFSFLRGMYEVKIANLFSKYGKDYFKKFSSCNNNFKILKNESNSNHGFWCNNCPKCAFVFSILRPYITTNEVLEIFGADLYERIDLEKLFRELLGISGIKPFECVGEAEEVVYSMYLTIKNHYNDEEKLPFILQIFKNEILSKMQESEFKNIEKKLVTIYNDDIIPTQFKDILKNNI